MDKKWYLIKLLDSMSEIWSLAKWLKIIVEKWELNDGILDMIIDALKWAIHTAKNGTAINKLQKWIDFLQKMKEMEIRQIEQDKKDIEQLDELIRQF